MGGEVARALGGAMLKPFEFKAADNYLGGRHDKREHPFGLRGSGWSHNDMQAAITTHAQVFGPERTAALAKAVMGSLAEPVNPRYYGMLIAQCAFELTSRPHVLSVMDTKQQRKPYA